MAKPAIQGDFRNAFWRNTVAEVKRKEGASLFEEDISGDGSGRITYQGTLGTYKTLISYLFEAGLLICACYELDEKFVNTERYIEVFNEFLLKLKSKYGDKEVIFKWRGQDMSRYYEEGGITLGDCVHHDWLALTCGWRTNNTIIIIEAQNPKGTE